MWTPIATLLLVWTTAGAADIPESQPPADWLEIRVSPESARLHVDGNVARALVAMELTNQTKHRVRVDRARLVFLDGSRVRRSVWLDQEFFRDGRFPRRSRIDAGKHEEWRGICIEDPPEGADRVRIELDLRASRRLRRLEQRQSVEIPLQPPEPPVPLRLPFEGYWRVVQGHGCETNHLPGFGGDYAWDFVALGPDGRHVREAFPVTRRNVDTFSFGRTLLAPVGGIVVSVTDGAADQEGLEDYPRRSMIDSLHAPDWIFGNYVVIGVSDDIFVLIGHLERGSIQVRRGDRVSAGQPIARCGNSGNTIEPHVHLQVMNRADPSDPNVRGLPAAFADYMEYSAVHRGDERDVQADLVSLGDPVEGRVVAPVKDR